MTDDQQKAAEPVERLSIGVIVAPQGIRGAVRMQIWTHFPEHIPSLTYVYLNDEPTARHVRSARVAGAVAILDLEGIETRNEAETLRGTIVRIDRDQAAPLAEDEYYYHQLIGLPVYDETGAYLGRLDEIIETGANDVYVIHDEAGNELLLPALKQVILEIDIDRGRIVARPLDYL